MTSGHLIIVAILLLILAKMPRPDQWAELPAMVGGMLLLVGVVVMIAEAWRKGL